MKRYTITEIDNFILVHNIGGKDIAYDKNSGVNLLEVDGFAFKDLNKNGVLDAYEDWRLPLDERIDDLVAQLSIRDIAGLMLYSQHQSISSADNIFAKMFQGTYDGKTREESGKEVWELSDQQKQFLGQDGVRHVLMTMVDDARTAAKWNNQMQAYVEKLPFGIPCNNSSDPRHTPSAHTEFDAGAGGDISKWPESLGLAASFDPKLVYDFGQIAAKEYRALGIATALSPQIDMASEPRWMRFSGTFGENCALSTDMAMNYCDGFQTTTTCKGWGDESVNAMVKHWPGGGSGESGRDAHYAYGKYAVYPANNFEEHKQPFVKGAFQLPGGTKRAAALMPYYTISYDVEHNENVGNSYSTYMIKDLLQGKYGYDGVVCTDWMITKDAPLFDSFLSGKCWGVETLSEAQRHYKILMAGVDQFGGNNEIQPVLDAYKLGCEEHGEAYMKERFAHSGKKLLRNIFQTGLFENPYVDPKTSQSIVGNQTFMQAGYEAQKKSIVMLKNKGNVLPMKKKQKVYIPKRRIQARVDWFGNTLPAHEEMPVNNELMNRYYQMVDDPKQADFALVFIESPQCLPYTNEEGYLPISLQYRAYTATLARDHSIAQDPSDDIVDRTYKDKTNSCSNEADLDIILETRELIGNKPVIVSMNCKNPTVVKEFEANIDALLINFNVQTQAILDIVSGQSEPSALLPFQMPYDMETVETQAEDISGDMKCYEDEEGHCYDFAFGMNYKGVIDDERVKQYKKEKA